MFLGLDASVLDARCRSLVAHFSPFAPSDLGSILEARLQEGLGGGPVVLSLSGEMIYKMIFKMFSCHLLVVYVSIFPLKKRACT